MERRRDIFQAIADPTRREIVGVIAGKPLTVNEIAGRFSQSRSTISGHLKILRECGLITIEKQGRERICRAELERLQVVSAWIDQYRNFWHEKLDALENLLGQTDDPGKAKP